MDEIWTSLYLVPAPVFGILVLLAVAVMLELEGLLSLFRRPRREPHEGKSPRSRNRLSALRNAGKPRVDSPSAVVSDHNQGQAA